MADRPFERMQTNPREKPLSGDLNQMSGQLDYALREFARRQNGYRLYDSADTTFQEPSGFLTDGFQPRAGTGLQIILAKGLGFQHSTDAPTNIDGCNNLDDLSPTKPLVLLNDQSIAIPDADSTNPRLDIIEVKHRLVSQDPDSRNVLDVVSGKFVPTLVNKTLSPILDGDVTINSIGPINYKTGTPTSVPTFPSVDAGYVRIGYVLIPPGATQILDRNVFDDRRVLSPLGFHKLSFVFNVETVTWTLRSASSLAPNFLAIPGTKMGVVTQTFSSGPFNGVTGIGVVACKGAVPEANSDHWGHATILQPSIRVTLGSNQITTAAQGKRPLIWTPLIETQTSNLFQSTGLSAPYTSSFPDPLAEELEGQEAQNGVCVFGFPMIWNTATQLYDQSFNAQGITLLRVEVEITLAIPKH